jgi:excisionase family DNA binding protein
MQKRRTDLAMTPPGDKVLVSVEEAAAMLSLGRTVVYRLVRLNEISSIKVGRNRRVVASSLPEYVRRLASIAGMNGTKEDNRGW